MAASVKKNFAYNTVYQALLVLLPLITAPYVSRALGAEPLGIYSYTNAIASYFVLVAMLGISNHGNRSVAAVRDDEHCLSEVFSSIYALQVITFSVAIVLYALFCIFFSGENETIMLIQLPYVISGLLDVSWLFFGLEKFGITVFRNVLIKVITVVLIFTLVKSPDDMWLYAFIMSVGTFLSQAYLWIYVRKYTSFSRVSFGQMARNVKPALVLFVPVLAYSIYKVMDKIMLGSMCPYEEVAFYQNAEKIVNIPMGVITALGTVMLPRMSNLLANGEDDEAVRYIRISTKTVTLLASALGFGIMGVADVLAPVYLGEEFASCGSLTEILSLTVFFIAWANIVRTQYLIPLHRDRVYVASTAAGAVVNLALNLLLIPVWQSMGAAVGTVAAEFAVMAIQVLCTRKEIPLIRYIASYLPVVVAGLAMMLLVHWIGTLLGVNVATLLIQVAAGAILFAVSTTVILFFKKDELLTTIKRTFTRKRKCIE